MPTGSYDDEMTQSSSMAKGSDRSGARGYKGDRCRGARPGNFFTNAEAVR